MLKRLAVAAVVLLVFGKPAYAYLDPGTASMIAQGVLGGIAAVTAYFGHKFGLLRRFLRRNQKDDASKDVSETHAKQE